jgi:hypothetical protein
MFEPPGTQFRDLTPNPQIHQGKTICPEIKGNRSSLKEIPKSHAGGRGQPVVSGRWPDSVSEPVLGIDI